MSDKETTEARISFVPVGTASFLYDWANIFLILALVLGVASTVLVVWMGGIKEAYLNKDLADTAERAKKAERATAEQVAKNLAFAAAVSPRRLEQMHTAEQLKQFSDVAFRVMSPGDFEARATAGKIRFMLKQAGWQQHMVTPSVSLPYFDGVHVCDLYPLQVHPVKVTYHLEAQGNIVIQPGGVYTIDQGTGCGMLDPLTSDDYTSLTNGKKTFFVTGYIKFKDVFDQHWTKGFYYRSWGNGFIPDEGHNQETKDK
jgi:hypothetical protein